ncbi:MAG: nitronate monooxygenase [Chloroflexi bacterium]|nr:nitronate monooxygenase [Chloroflexota bacterium]
MLATRFTELVGCSVPIQQAAMGGIATPELAAAVSEAGGLGMLGTSRNGITPESLSQLIDDTQARTSVPFGVNFIASPAQLDVLDLTCIDIAARRARVVEFFFGEPSRDLVGRVHAGGALVAWQVGSCPEAVVAQAAGCDLIVVQGVEAGGFIRGVVGLHALLNEVLSEVDVPVLAAGGIGTGRAMAAALVAGADGVRVGTRFAASEESGAHPQYVQALIGARPEDTVLAEVFVSTLLSGRHRVLRSSLEAAQAFDGDIVGQIGSLDGTRVPVPRLRGLAVDRSATGTIEAMSLFAGESVGAVRDVQFARDIVRELAADAERLLRATEVQGPRAP